MSVGLWCMQAVLTVVEILGAYLFSKYVSKERISGFRKWVLRFGMGILICLTIYQRTNNMYSRVWLIITILYCCLISMLCNKQEKAYSCIAYAIYFETIYCLDLFIYIGIAIIFLNKNFLISQFQLGGERIVVYLVTRSIVAIFMIWLFWKKKLISFYFKTNKLIWIIALLTEHLSLILCDRVFIPGFERNALIGWRAFWLIYPFFITILVFFFIKQNYKMMYEQIKIRNILYCNQYEAMEKELRQKEQIYHDYRNHLILLQKMVSCGDSVQAKSYLNYLLKSINKECVRRVGHPVLDYLLHIKILEAHQRNIQIKEEYASNLCELNEEQIRDWGVLLGNLWDNAIEGCEEAEEECKIFFSVKQVGNMVIVKIVNSCHQNVNLNNLKTKKTNSQIHGIGLHNIEFVVNKHEGTIKRECGGGFFSTQVIMVE